MSIMAKAQRLYYDQIAEMRGVKVTTVRTEALKARMARRDPDKPYLRKSHDMPEPDGYERRSPWWYKSTIDRWLASRPGAVNQKYIDEQRKS